jgi:hypothetical protein
LVAEGIILDYLLKFDHEQGGPKARFFAHFGFTREYWTAFRSALKQHPRANCLVKINETKFGRKYLVSCTLVTPDGRNPCINTVWIEDGDATPRLVTAYPNSV